MQKSVSHPTNKRPKHRSFPVERSCDERVETTIGIYAKEAQVDLLTRDSFEEGLLISRLKDRFERIQLLQY